MTKFDDDDDKVAKDRAVVRVPLVLMDSVQKQVASRVDASLHAPSSALLTDAQSQVRQRMYDAADKKLQDAWKAPASSIKAKPPSPAVSLDAARESYERRLRDAWRAT